MIYQLFYAMNSWSCAEKVYRCTVKFFEEQHDGTSNTSLLFSHSQISLYSLLVCILSIQNFQWFVSPSYYKNHVFEDNPAKNDLESTPTMTCSNHAGEWNMAQYWHQHYINIVSIWYHIHKLDLNILKNQLPMGTFYKLVVCWYRFNSGINPPRTSFKNISKY